MLQIDTTEISKEIKEKYSIVSNSFRRTIKKNPELDKYTNTPKDLITAEVGDVKQTDFYPQLKLARWGNNEEVGEVNFSVRLKHNEGGTETVETIGDKIKWNKGNIDIEFYDFAEGEGGYKMVWYLKKKPKTNKVEFSIQSKSLDFFRQPPLTEEYQSGYSEEFKKEIIVTETDVKDLEGNVLVNRPIEVVGSYVFYHKTKGGMVDAWGKDYKTGQGGIIYSPHLIDAVGKECRGKLNITWTNPEKTEGIYSVEISQDFLDTAIYPIKSNDDFGFTDIGGSSSFWSQAHIEGSDATMPQDGTLDSITFYLGTTGDGYGRFELYIKSSGVLNGYSNYTSYTDDNTWIPVNVPNGTLSLSNGVAYWITHWNQSPAKTSRYNTATSRGVDYTHVATDGVPPNIGASPTLQNLLISIYATYTPSGGGAEVKTVNGLALASVKTYNGLAIASVKTINGATTS